MLSHKPKEGLDLKEKWGAVNSHSIFLILCLWLADTEKSLSEANSGSDCAQAFVSKHYHYYCCCLMTSQDQDLTFNTNLRCLILSSSNRMPKWSSKMKKRKRRNQKQKWEPIQAIIFWHIRTLLEQLFKLFVKPKPELDGLKTKLDLPATTTSSNLEKSCDYAMLKDSVLLLLLLPCSSPGFLLHRNVPYYRKVLLC